MIGTLNLGHDLENHMVEIEKEREGRAYLGGGSRC